VLNQSGGRQFRTHILDAPGLGDVDLAVTRTLQPTERINLQLRYDVQRSPTSIHVPDISAHTLQGSLLDRFYPPLPCLPAVLFTACYGADSIIISICQNAKVGTFDRAQHIAVGDPQEQLHFRLEPNFAVAIPFKLGSNPLQQL